MKDSISLIYFSKKHLVVPIFKKPLFLKDFILKIEVNFLIFMLIELMSVCYVMIASKVKIQNKIYHIHAFIDIIKKF